MLVCAQNIHITMRVQCWKGRRAGTFSLGRQKGCFVYVSLADATRQQGLNSPKKQIPLGSWDTSCSIYTVFPPCSQFKLFTLMQVAVLRQPPPLRTNEGVDSRHLNSLDLTHKHLKHALQIARECNFAIVTHCWQPLETAGRPFL